MKSLVSKKLISALIAAVSAFVAALCGMEAETIMVIIAPFVAQITGQSVVDFKSAIPKVEPTNDSPVSPF